MYSPLPVTAQAKSIDSAFLGVSPGSRLRPASRRGSVAILFSCLLVLSISGCTRAVDPTAPTGPSAPAGPRTDDYWPMQTGNTWTFNYNFSFRDWENYGLGRSIEGTYTGTLTWEIVSTTETPDEVKSTFKQKFVGVASELVLRSLPDDYVTNTYDKVDTATTFDLTIQADSIIRLSANSSPAWQYQGALIIIFATTDVYRYPRPKVPKDSTIMYSSGFTSSTVVLGRMIGPVSLYYAYGGNTHRQNLSANLISHTQRALHKQ